LRLDFLFQQADYFLHRPSKMDSRVAITTLINLLNVLQRGDIRSDALKEMDKFSRNLQNYLTYPGVDTDELKKQLTDIAQTRQNLEALGMNLGGNLRDHEFLNSIKQRSAIPGGACNFDIPAFAHWLRNPFEQRVSDLENWYSGITPLHKAIQRVLWLTRESSQHTEEVAQNGLFQQQLGRNSQVSLIRVGMPDHSEIYPEISGSQHRFTVRFYQPGEMSEKAKQTNQDIQFRLICC
jgi:cell division protein ZapD